jgi:hypothetical protein
MNVRKKWVLFYPFGKDPEAWPVFKDATLGIYPRRSRVSVARHMAECPPYCIVREKAPPAFKFRGVH